MIIKISTLKWQKKIKRARSVEQEILSWILKTADKKAHFPIEPVKEYDIESKKLGNVEVKEDRMAHGTGFYAIEYQDASGNPSGLFATTANTFILVDWSYVLVINTQVFRDLIKGMQFKKQVSMGYRTNEGKQAKGIS